MNSRTIERPKSLQLGATYYLLEKSMESANSNYTPVLFVNYLPTPLLVVVRDSKSNRKFIVSRNDIYNPFLEQIEQKISRESRLQVHLELQPAGDELRKEISRKPYLLDNISPRKFEVLVASIWRDFGFEIELTARTRDGGYDIIAVKREQPTSLRILVEAKRYPQERKVGVGIVRSLYGTKNIKAVSQVVLATSSYVSNYAKQEFERVIPWELDFMERDKIINWCKQLGGYDLAKH